MSALAQTLGKDWVHFSQRFFCVVTSDLTEPAGCIGSASLAFTNGWARRLQALLSCSYPGHMRILGIIKVHNDVTLGVPRSRLDMS